MAWEEFVGGRSGVSEFFSLLPLFREVVDLAKTETEDIISKDSEQYAGNFAQNEGECGALSLSYCKSIVESQTACSSLSTP